MSNFAPRDGGDETCDTCNAPAPTHEGWCPRWRWDEESSCDRPDGLPPMDTGLKKDWQDPQPEPEPNAPDDFASQDPDADAKEDKGDDRDSASAYEDDPVYLTPTRDFRDERVVATDETDPDGVVTFGMWPDECIHPAPKYSVARGVCTACGVAMPPPKCGCVDCLRFTPHPRPDADKALAELARQYAGDKAAPPFVQRAQYMFVGPVKYKACRGKGCE